MIIWIFRCIHYFDTVKFFAEVDRLLKPGGILVYYTWVVSNFPYPVNFFSYFFFHKSDCNLKFWTWYKARIKLRSWREFMMSISKRTLETILLNLLIYLKDSRSVSISFKATHHPKCLSIFQLKGKNRKEWYLDILRPPYGERKTEIMKTYRVLTLSTLR